jgi:hypothetical protein
MRHIDYGLGAFNGTVFQALPEDHVCDLAAVYQDLLQRHELVGYEVWDRFYEIGSKAGIEELEVHLMTSKQAAVFLDRDGVLK